MRITSSTLLRGALALKGTFAGGVAPTKKCFDGVEVPPFKDDAHTAVCISADFELNWALLRRVPRVGRAVTYRLLIPDYHGQFALSDEALKEWAILDMFDMLSPAYDQPQSLATVRRWFGGRFVQVDVRYGYNGIQGRGVKSTA